LGEYDQLGKEFFPPDSYLAIDVIRHPFYRNDMKVREDGFLESEPRFDVALLMLDRKVQLAPNVAPICLPFNPADVPPGTLLPQPPDVPGAAATVVGWGRLGRGPAAPHSSVLQAATVPILSDAECAALVPGLPANGRPDQVCAGSAAGVVNYGEEASACPGDSGGALQVRDDDGKWTIVGVVSNGPSICGLQPVVFHRVTSTMPWIKSIMEKTAAVP